MTYELAKQLKDAGFPQINSRARCPDGSYRSDLDGYCGHTLEDAASIPTLSELIEACMEDKQYSFELGGQTSWFAIMRKDNNSKAVVPVQTAHTPEEAVAKLYLALHARNQ